MHVKLNGATRTRVALLLATVAAAFSASMFTTPAVSAAQPESAVAQHEAITNTPLQGTQTDVSTQAAPIKRSDVMARAKRWVDLGVPYSNDAPYQDGYRRDCSGFVSYAWAADQSYTTESLPSISHRISKDELLPGDIMLWQNPKWPVEFGHVRIFGGWLDTAKNRYWVYEQTPPKAVYNEYSWAGTYPTYLPYRYNHIVNDAQTSRFAFLNSEGHLFAKDELYGSWLAFNGGGASDMVVSGDWTGAIGNGTFFAKQGLYGAWLTMSGGGQVTDIAISGERFGFLNSAGLAFVKDGINASWVQVHSNVTALTITHNWIGVVIGGNFLAKQGLYDTWYTMASGGNATKIVINGDWYGMIAGGNFLAKQGPYGSWYTMASGGQATHIGISTIS